MPSVYEKPMRGLIEIGDRNVIVAQPEQLLDVRIEVGRRREVLAVDAQAVLDLQIRVAPIRIAERQRAGRAARSSAGAP